MVEAKATARHEKMARSKKEQLEHLKARINSEKNNIAKTKADRKAKIKAMPREQQAEARMHLDEEIQTMKNNVAKSKEEYKALKAEIKADEAKAKEARKAEKQ